jgi:hypothetical protein
VGQVTRPPFGGAGLDYVMGGHSISAACNNCGRGCFVVLGASSSSSSPVDRCRLSCHSVPFSFPGAVFSHVENVNKYE